MEHKEKLEETYNNSSFDISLKNFKHVLINSRHSKRRKVDLITASSLLKV